MTRERTRLLAPVLKAWAEGKDIQKRVAGLARWEDVHDSSPEFEEAAYEWRIKPEPRKIWINEYRREKSGDALWGVVCDSAEQADRYAASTHGTVHVRTHEITLSD